MKKTITIVDYGSGNLLSAQQSFIKAAKLIGVDAEIQISNNPKNLEISTHVVLPGQGAFKTCMDGIQKIPGMEDELNKFVKIKQRPFFGICVGMQLLAEKSLEFGECEGFGWIPGEVIKIEAPADYKIPHMGWNEVTFRNHELLNNISQNTDFYFVHSYYFRTQKNENCIATTKYPNPITAAVLKENIFGTQFHPEKSHNNGKQIIINFLEWEPS